MIAYKYTKIKENHWSHCSEDLVENGSWLWSRLWIESKSIIYLTSKYFLAIQGRFYWQGWHNKVQLNGRTMPLIHGVPLLRNIIVHINVQGIVSVKRINWKIFLTTASHLHFFFFFNNAWPVIKNSKLELFGQNDYRHWKEIVVYSRL